MDDTGDFVIAWEDDNQDGSNPEPGIFARRFASDGTALAAELQVNSYTVDLQAEVAVAVGGAGDFVIAWCSAQQDGDKDGVFGQRFETVFLFDIDGDGALEALTDGILALRFLFGFTGTTLTSGAVNTDGCTRCDAAAIEAYLQTLI
jgi:hypothetical protein